MGSEKKLKDDFATGLHSLIEHERTWRQLANQDVFALLLHTFMMEIGFRPYDRPSAEEKKNPVDRNINDAYKFEYDVANTPATTKPLVTLRIIKTGPILNIIGKLLARSNIFVRHCNLFHFSVTGNFHGSPHKSFPLHGIRVHDVVEDFQPTEDNGFKLKNIADLNRRFKNSVAYPLMHEFKNAQGLKPGIESFLCLPNEVVLNVLTRVRDHKDVINMSRTCKRLNRSGKDNSIRKTLFKRYIFRFSKLTIYQLVSCF